MAARSRLFRGARNRHVRVLVRGALLSPLRLPPGVLGLARPNATRAAAVEKCEPREIAPPAGFARYRALILSRAEGGEVEGMGEVSRGREVRLVLRVEILAELVVLLLAVPVVLPVVDAEARVVDAPVDE